MNKSDEVKVVKPPDLIFLQFDEYDIPDTFCVDRINNRDVEYVRLDMVKAAIEPVLVSAKQEVKNNRAATAKLLTYRPWMDGIIVEGVEIPIADLDILCAFRDALEATEEVGDE